MVESGENDRGTRGFFELADRVKVIHAFHRRSQARRGWRASVTRSSVAASAFVFGVPLVTRRRSRLHVEQDRQAGTGGEAVGAVIGASARLQRRSSNPSALVACFSEYQLWLRPPFKLAGGLDDQRQ